MVKIIFGVLLLIGLCNGQWNIPVWQHIEGNCKHQIYNRQKAAARLAHGITGGIIPKPLQPMCKRFLGKYSTEDMFGQRPKPSAAAHPYEVALGVATPDGPNHGRKPMWGKIYGPNWPMCLPYCNPKDTMTGGPDADASGAYAESTFSNPGYWPYDHYKTSWAKMWGYEPEDTSSSRVYPHTSVEDYEKQHNVKYNSKTGYFSTPDSRLFLNTKPASQATYSSYPSTYTGSGAVGTSGTTYARQPTGTTYSSQPTEMTAGGTLGTTYTGRNTFYTKPISMQGRTFSSTNIGTGGRTFTMDTGSMNTFTDNSQTVGTTTTTEN